MNKRQAEKRLKEMQEAKFALVVLRDEVFKSLHVPQIAKWLEAKLNRKAKK